MAQAAGYAVLPVMPSMSGFGAALQKQIVGPATKAGKEAGDSIGKGMQSGVQSAQKAVDGALYRVKKSTEEQQAAESKLAEQKLKVEAANKAVESAARKREEAESKGIDAIERAEETLLKKRAAAEKASRDLASAESKVEGALTESAKAAKNLEDKQEDLTRAQNESRREAEKYEGVFGKLRKAFKDAARGADDTGGAFGRFSKEARELNKNTSGIKLGAVAGVFASATSSITSSLGGLASEAVTASDATDKFKSTMDFAGIDGGTIDEMTKKTKEYADSTVYDLADIQNMTAQLASNGVDNYQELAEAAGNMNAVAGGNSETFKSVGMVMTQTAGAGKLTTENWNQLADAIPGASGKVQEALKQNGAFTGNFREAMEEGQITAEEFNDAVMQIGTDPIAVEAAESTKTFEGMIGNLKATITGGLADALNELKPTLEPILKWVSDMAGRLLPSLVDSVKNTVEWTKEAFSWIKENQAWLTPLAVGIGAVAGAWGAWTLAVKGYNSAIEIAGIVTKGFDKITKGTIWGAIALAVIGVVSALTYFFTQTETGRKAWANFTEFVKNAWQAVSDKFTGVWNWLRDSVFTPMANFVTQTLWPAIQSTAQWIGDKWNWMKDIFTNAWNWIRDVVINPFVTFMTTVLWPNIMNTVQWIVDKWNWMRDLMGAAWGWIRDNVIQLFINGANNLWDMVSQAIGWIVDKWNWMRDRLFDGWSWIDNNVFSPLKRGLDVVKGWFETTVDNIGTAWDTIKEKTRAPIEFVVNTVYNKGIKPAWNAVAGFVGMDDKKLPDIAFASGGVLPGYSPGRDDYRFVDPKSGYSIALGGGESIMRPEWTKAVGGQKAVDAMNRSARIGGVNGVRKQLGEGAAFKNGGTIDENIARTMAALRPEHGKPYQYGGVGNPSWDCSGLWSGIVQSLNGGNLRGGRIFNTESNFADFGFEPGLSGRVTIGVMNGGGGMNSHMAGTIDGVNLESGGSNGVQIGGAAIGSDASSLPNRYTLTKFLGEFVSGGNGGGGGNPIASLAKAAWDKVIDALPATPSFPGWVGEFPGKAKDMFVDTLWNWVKSKLPFGGGRQGGVGAGVEQWRGLVEQVLSAKGYDKSMSDTVLRRMNQESGGNPSAINNWDSNASAGTPSKGLMQVIDPTFQAYKDPGYDDIWDPESNIRASMNYAVSRYGSLPAAYDRAGGYHNGGLAGFGQGLMKKTAMEPEMVLDPAMTKAFIQWMGVADDVAKAVQPTAAKSANAYVTGQAQSVLDIFGLGSVATTAGSWWDKNGEQVTADALSLYGATQNPDSVATVSAFGQSATFEFNAESLDDVVRVGDLTAALEQVGVRTNVRKKSTAVLTRGGAL